MLKRLIHNLENVHFTAISWLGAIAGIVLIRNFLESLSSPYPIGGIMPNILTIIHFGLFFLAVSLLILVILFLLIPSYRKYSFNLVGMGISLVLLAPILDLIFTQGEGSQLRYLIDKDLILTFLTFFGTNLENGATLGIRIEIGLALVILATYIYTLTRSWIRTLVGVVLAYAGIFLAGALPSILASLSYGHGVRALEFTNFYVLPAKDSVLNFILTEPMYIYRSAQGYFGMLFNSIMGQIFLIMSLAFGAIASFIFSPIKAKAIFHNMRFERVLYYLVWPVLGIALAHHLGFILAWNWVDILALITLLVAVSSAWVAAVFFNDIADVAIDKISNGRRPFVQGVLSRNEMQETAWIFTIISLLAAYMLGNTTFFLILLYSALQWMYSFCPLRIKRIFPFNSIVIALAGLITMYAGFFFAAAALTAQTLPLTWAIGIFIFIFCICHIRDLKDIESDATEPIYTIPVLFGENRGRKIIALLSGAATVLTIPLLTSSPPFLFITLPAGLLAYWLITTKKHPEKGAFAIFFVLMLSLVSYLFMS